MRIALLIWLCCLGLVGLAAPTGTVMGTITFDGGTPYADAYISIRTGGVLHTVLSAKDGSFTVQATVGSGIIYVATHTFPVTVTAGRTTRVSLVLKRDHGVLVRLRYPDDTPASCDVSGGYHAQTRSSDSLFIIRLGVGTFWFVNVPAEATEFGIYGHYNDTVAPQVDFQHRWRFDKPAKLRALTHIIPKQPVMTVTVVNAAGTPMPHLAVSGLLTYHNAIWVSDDNGPREGTQRFTTNIRGTTDQHGMLSLGRIPPWNYILTLQAGDISGAQAAFTVLANGDVSLQRYTMGYAPRDVTQTVCNANGKPAPGAEVTISYCWKKQWVLLSNTADANGAVEWKNLPPVRAIVWGKDVPAGVISPEMTNVTQPLPAPKPERPEIAKISLVQTGDTPVNVHVYVIKTDSTEYRMVRGNPGGETPVPHIGLYTESGSSFSLLAFTESSPPRIAWSGTVYMPYTSGDAYLTYPALTLSDGVEVQGRLLTTLWQPVQMVSRLDVVPVEVADAPPSITRVPGRKDPGYPLIRQGNGEFTMLLAKPGRYRLLVDMYDELSAPLPGMIFTAKSGINHVTVTLPPPLTTLPNGGEINWLRMDSPCVAGHLQAEKGMPIYGPGNDLLAWWHQPTPELLVLRKTGDNAETILARRAVQFTPPANYQSDFSLHPLLPVFPHRPVPGAVDAKQREPGTAELPTPLNRSDGYSARVFPGSYALTDASGERVLDVINVPAVGPETIPIRLTPAQLRLGDQRERYLDLYLPANGPKVVDGDSISGHIGITFDVPGYRRVYMPGGRNITCAVPQAATRLSLSWFGVGTITDVAIPPDTLTDAEKRTRNMYPATRVQLPAWQPGVPFSGQIMDIDGKPYANRRIDLSLRVAADGPVGCTFMTDAQGRFTITHAVPNTVYLKPRVANEYAYWVVDIPANGLRDVRLRITTDIYHETPEYPCGSPGLVAWWLPDAGTARRLAAFYDCIGDYDAPRTSGWVWCVDMTGQVTARYLTVASKRMLLHYAPQGPSLALAFPLDLAIGMPGKMHLTHLRTGVTLDVPPTIWHASPLFNKVFGQCISIPPGDYTITIETPRGPVTRAVTVGTQDTSLALDYPAQ